MVEQCPNCDKEFDTPWAATVHWSQVHEGDPPFDISGENHPHHGKKQSQETRDKISESVSELDTHPMQREEVALRSGKNRSAPSINIDLESEYHPESKRGVYKRAAFRDQFRCQDCLTPHYKNEITDIHHIDRDDRNHTLENVVLLCRKCHRNRHNT